MLIVFVDQYLPFDRDKDLRYKYHLPYYETYFNKLDKFFTKLEDKYKTKVIILAHPSSDYDTYFKSSDLWRGRKVIKDRTKEFIEKADLVLGHYSKALEWAKGKKIISITFDEFDRGGITKELIEPKSKEYGADLVNIDKEDICL